ncbi:MAG: FAD-binding protein, partial [Clostridia bacterium]|nr:FAD-binding protein [Clostridia bacterium]
MSKNLSRRDFLKGAAVGAAGIGILGLTGCGNAAAEATQAPTPAPEVTLAPTVAPQVEIAVPESLTLAEFEDSCVELAEITEFVGEVTADIVVVGAGAAGVPAAITAAEEGSSVVILQKQSTVVSQGNCGSGLIIDESDTEGLLRYVHHTN